MLWDGNGPVVKRVEAVGGEPPRLRLISANADYPPYTCLAEEAHIVGKVVWKISREHSRTAGCVPFPDPARLICTRPILRSPTAARGKDNMNKADLVSHATETSTTRAAAERMVGAVFSAIADALARDEPVANAGFGKFAVRSRAARQGRNPRTGEPVVVPASKVPSFKPAKAFRDAVNE